MLCLGLDIGGTSVKAALVTDGRLVAQHVGPPYQRPSAEELKERIGAAADTLRADRTPGARLGIEAVGICVPGALSDDRRHVTYSTNIPALQGLELASLAVIAAGRRDVPHVTTTDQIAAATDYAASRAIRGRLLAVSIGTGVGAAVLDFSSERPLGEPLAVNGLSPGHIGQVDVSLDADPPVGPDGGAGSLEAYIGGPALAGRDPATLGIDDPPIRALVRALRICHALYRPDEIALLGGVGIRLSRLAEALKARIDDRLTALARPGWRLGFGEDDFHAARGAARLAEARKTDTPRG
jgi:predicted NBD/HSP70 family sugar kinase